MIVRHIFRIFCLIASMALLLSLARVVPYFLNTRVHKSLCLYTWQEKIDEQLLQRFEQQTGIKVYVNYYESNEELLTKLSLAQEPDCDIMLPTAFMVEYLQKSNLIQKIDQSKLKFLDQLYPEFRQTTYDPDGEYCLPLYWDFLVIGYTHSYFPDGLPKNSWDIIFNEDDVPCPQISMIDDARDAICIAMMHLGLPMVALQEDQKKQLVDLFIEQKKWIGVYTDFLSGYYLTSKAYPLAVSQRENLVQEMMDNPDIAVTLPDEGSLLFVDTLVLSAHCKHPEWAYEFINFLFSKESVEHNCREYSLLPTRKDVAEQLDYQHIQIPEILPGNSRFTTLKNLPNIFTPKQFTDIWIHCRAS